MKENFFEILLSLFENSLNKLKEKDNAAAHVDLAEEALIEPFDLQDAMLHIREAGEVSARIIIEEERVKMSKASYQFISRMKRQGILTSYTLELLMNEILFSESRIVHLQETKSMIREILSENFAPAERAYLDLLLYQKENHYTIQ